MLASIPARHGPVRLDLKFSCKNSILPSHRAHGLQFLPSRSLAVGRICPDTGNYCRPLHGVMYREERSGHRASSASAISATRHAPPPESPGAMTCSMDQGALLGLACGAQILPPQLRAPTAAPEERAPFSRRGLGRPRTSLPPLGPTRSRGPAGPLGGLLDRMSQKFPPWRTGSRPKAQDRVRG